MNNIQEKAKAVFEAKIAYENAVEKARRATDAQREAQMAVRLLNEAWGEAQQALLDAACEGFGR